MFVYFDICWSILILMFLFILMYLFILIYFYSFVFVFLLIFSSIIWRSRIEEFSFLKKKRKSNLSLNGTGRIHGANWFYFVFRNIKPVNFWFHIEQILNLQTFRRRLHFVIFRFVCFLFRYFFAFARFLSLCFVVLTVILLPLQPMIRSDSK